MCFFFWFHFIDFLCVSLLLFTGIGPVLGLLFIPLIGSASDTCNSSYGRRRPFIWLLSSGVLLALFIIPHADVLAARLSWGGRTLQVARCFSLIVELLNFCCRTCNKITVFSIMLWFCFFGRWASLSLVWDCLTFVDRCVSRHWRLFCLTCTGARKTAAKPSLCSPSWSAWEDVWVTCCLRWTGVAAYSLFTLEARPSASSPSSSSSLSPACSSP